MIMLGGLEILAICGLIGGVTGYFFRNKDWKNGAVIGVLLGIVGALFTTWLLEMLIYSSQLVMPVYAIAGAWLANYAARKSSAKG